MHGISYRIGMQGMLLWALFTATAVLAAPADDDGTEHVVSPEFIEGVTTVDAEGLIEKVMHTPELVLIDSRISGDRKEGYIEGSISLPDIETNCASLGKVVPGKHVPMLFYCNGIHCGRSAKAAVIAQDCGYTSIFWFRNGMQEWQDKEYPLVQ